MAKATNLRCYVKKIEAYHNSLKGYIFSDCPCDILFKSELTERKKIEIILHSFNSDKRNDVQMELLHFRNTQSQTKTLINKNITEIREAQSSRYRIAQDIIKYVGYACTVHDNISVSMRNIVVSLANINKFIKEAKINKKQTNLFEDELLEALSDIHDVLLNNKDASLLKQLSRYL